MSILDSLIAALPEVKSPTQKKLSFKEKLKWTLIILIIFFVMGLIPLFGLGENALQQFEFLSIILGASFGSILSLGIGPIVTASIVLQLLNGTGILKMDTHTPQGRQRFQGIQKILAIFFIVFESGVYVLMGGLAPSAVYAGTALYFQFELFLIFQLILGGVLIMYMDEVISKWGFGSGISLFIAAGVTQQVFIRAFNFLPSPTNPEIAAGAIPSLFQFLSMGDVTGALLQIAALVSTIVVFMVCVYGQAMKVEIPLSFGRVRGYSMRWPLNFFYTSNIPVILVAALMANVQLIATLLDKWGHPWLGTFSGSTPISGVVYWISSPDILRLLITGSFGWQNAVQGIIYTLLMVVGAIIFSVFWMQTANMDAASQAKQIMASGLQIPGF
ncbi:MAG: preprotein translocase subunit SecY, partial [Nanoarchaeota archaeon]|nr:preprotein translocase subunit SecY [Nanoarchaeota archaeon]